jgi:hypothetical protein
MHHATRYHRGAAVREGGGFLVFENSAKDGATRLGEAKIGSVIMIGQSAFSIAEHRSASSCWHERTQEQLQRTPMILCRLQREGMTRPVV